MIQRVKAMLVNITQTTAELFHKHSTAVLITRGHNLKLSRQTCRSRIRHDYFSQRIVEFWNGLPSDVVNASTVNSFKGRLNKHWKEYVFAVELPPRTVAFCH